MNFDKFGAFPKTEPLKRQKKANDNLLPDFLKLLPNLVKSKNDTPVSPSSNLKEEQKTVYSSNKKAYSEYLSRHDAHVRKSKDTNQS